MPRFVLLHHKTPPSMGGASHWDFMLESAGSLQTWRLPQLPASWRVVLGASSADASTGTIAATKLADHRLAYLNYEGPVSGDRGEVRRRDGGEYTIVDQSERSLTVELYGKSLQGRVRLVQVLDETWRLELESPDVKSHDNPQ